MTIKLYEQDSYIKTFKAMVLSCEEKDGVCSIILDKTAFFPEGGGQPADVGTLDGVNVLHVCEKDGAVIHRTESPLPVGAEVEGRIDWEIRFSRMQSHAAEHMISGIVHSVFGYDNVGFHLSDNEMFVDFSGPLTQEDIDRVETETNLAIYNNTSIFASYPSADELASAEYRSKIDPKEGLRLITIEGVDCCACCAPHPARTGEIGIVKVIDFMPYKGGTRVFLEAGIRALRDYRKLNCSNKAMMKLLSSPRSEVSDAVEKQCEALRGLQGENQRLSRALVLSELDPVAVNSSVYAITGGASYDELRFCSNFLMEKGYENCILLSRADGDNYIYTVSSTVNAAGVIASQLNKSFNGKGGGKPNYAQGKVIIPDRLSIDPAIRSLL